MSTRTLLAFSAVALAASIGAQAQRAGGDIRLNVPPYGVVRSPMIQLAAGETLTVIPDEPGALTPAVFVYDSERRLIAKNDEAAEPNKNFEHTAASSGAVQVVLYGNSPRLGLYAIRVLPRAEIRGEKAAASHAVVRVLFATDRRLESRRPVAFSAEPSGANEVSYGTCYVSVPRDHRLGALEGPSIWRLEFTADPDRHITVVSQELSTRSRFFDAVGQFAKRSENQDALVFVHGYNVTFEDAARRTAQLSYDLGFQGPAILFSWPSQGTLLGYNRDVRNVDLSVETLRTLLTSLSRTPDVKRVHVIAHSMGNRALVGALARLGPEVAIREIALLAPDIDTEMFRRLAREFPRSIGPVALYASSRDAALMASATFAGYPRAGQGGSGIVVTSGIETIDASGVDAGLAGMRHLYYGDTSAILSDLFTFFRGTPAAKRFGLRPAQSKDGPYWIFAPVAR